MTTTATATTTDRLVDCPAWCRLQHGYRWDSLEDDGRESVGHLVLLGRPSPFAVEGDVHLEQETFSDGTSGPTRLVLDVGDDRVAEIPLTPWAASTMVRTFG